MFLIYDRLAAFATAINAPPGYLESAIQTAKVFALDVSSSLGLNYDLFMLDWDIGLNRLLQKIGNSIEFYKANPQQIKVDLEDQVIRPLYEMKIEAVRKREDQQTETVNLLAKIVPEIETIRQNAEVTGLEFAELIELVVLPAIETIRTERQTWLNDIYKARVENVDFNLRATFQNILENRFSLVDIIKQLLYPGDILAKVDLLGTSVRIDQENKIADVSSRSFIRDSEQWALIIKGKRSV